MSDNPLLQSVRIPGQTFRLPSRGLFYTNGELDDDTSDGEIVVNPMRTTEELTINNADKLLTGEAVTDVFSHCIPQVKKPRELLSQDVDYLMMCLRMVTYGDKMDIQFRHTCTDAEDHEYTVDLDNIIKTAREIDPTTLNKKFKMELKNGQLLTLRPPRFDRVIKLYQSFGNFESSNEFSDDDLRSNIIANLTDMIANVDGVDNSEFISEWLGELSAGFIGEINEFVAVASDWGIESQVTLQCEDCGNPMLVTIPVNPINFFT